MNTVCRLCGEEKTTSLSVELCDKTASNWIFRELIEFHTRIKIEPNKVLPQQICDECRLNVESFSEFSQNVQTVQDTFVTEDELERPVTECFEIQSIVLGEGMLVSEGMYPETKVKEQEETDNSSSSHETDSETEKVVEGAKVEPYSKFCITFCSI